MTLLELVERDYKKAKINYLRCVARKGAPEVDVKHLEELMKLRRQILQIVKEKTE